MKPLALLSALILALPALAGDAPQPWPQKGDVVYVSATVQARLSEYISQGTEPGQVAIMACAPLKVAHRSVKGPYPGWGMESAERLYAAFRGEGWVARFHSTEIECREVNARLGDGRFPATAGVNIYAEPATALQK